MLLHSFSDCVKVIEQFVNVNRYSIKVLRELVIWVYKTLDSVKTERKRK